MIVLMLPTADRDDEGVRSGSNLREFTFHPLHPEVSASDLLPLCLLTIAIQLDDFSHKYQVMYYQDQAPYGIESRGVVRKLKAVGSDTMFIGKRLLKPSDASEAQVVERNARRQVRILENMSTVKGITSLQEFVVLPDAFCEYNFCLRALCFPT